MLKKVMGVIFFQNIFYMVFGAMYVEKYRHKIFKNSPLPYFSTDFRNFQHSKTAMNCTFTAQHGLEFLTPIYIRKPGFKLCYPGILKNTRKMILFGKDLKDHLITF